MSTISIQDAQAQLPELIRRLAPGEEVVITADSEPVARLSSVASVPPPRTSEAMVIRAQWMKLQGFSEEDIAEQCNEAVYPGTVEEELEDLRVALQLREKSLSTAELEQLARTHQPPADW